MSNTKTPLCRVRRERNQVLMAYARDMENSLKDTFDMDPIAVRIEPRVRHSLDCLYMDCVQFDREFNFEDGLNLGEMLLHLQHTFSGCKLAVEDSYTSKCKTRIMFVLSIDV